MRLTPRLCAAFAAVALSTALVMSTAATAYAAAGDLDCTDFPFQETAQLVLNANPADPYKLDGTPANKVACDALPDRPAPAEPPADGDYLDCPDFKYQDAAKVVVSTNVDDPHKLVGTDGIACGALPGRPTDPPIAPLVLVCTDFTFQESAQVVLNAEAPADPFELDGTPANKVACDALPDRPTPPAPPAPPKPDIFDCTDFKFQEAAQAVYDADPTDPNKLDVDGDKIACDDLPDRSGTPDPNDPDPPTSSSATPTSASRSATTSPAATTSNPADDKNCADFANQAAAQAHLVLDTTDPDDLDSDADGLACEDHFNTQNQQVGVIPNGGVNTGGSARS